MTEQQSPTPNARRIRRLTFAARMVLAVAIIVGVLATLSVVAHQVALASARESERGAKTAVGRTHAAFGRADVARVQATAEFLKAQAVVDGHGFDATTEEKRRAHDAAAALADARRASALADGRDSAAVRHYLSSMDERKAVEHEVSLGLPLGVPLALGLLVVVVVLLLVRADLRRASAPPPTIFLLDRERDPS